jgi:hypothetical protein
LILGSWISLVSSALAQTPAVPVPVPAPLPPAIAEAGQPFFEVFTPRDYQGHGQVWTAAEDRAGLLYFGNLGRILIYDGLGWTQLAMPEASYVRALAIDDDDTLWIGGIDELGYAQTDATGQRIFVSLKDKLPATARTCGAIWKVLLTPHGPVFQTNTWLMRWNGQSFATLELPSASSWQMVRADNHLLLNQGNLGLFILADDGQTLSIAPTKRPDFLNNRAINFSLPGTAQGETLLGSLSTGLIVWNGETGQRFAPDLIAEVANNKLYGGTRLSDGRMILTTLQNGAYVVDDAGRLLAHLNQTNGLPTNTVINVFADRSGNAWLCLDQGIVRLDARPWLTWFSPHNGAPRSPLGTPVRFGDDSYLSSGSGLLKLVPATALQPARVEPVADFTHLLNHLVVVDDTLIGLGAQGLFSWRPGQESVSILGEMFNVGSFVPSRHQPGRWFAIADGNLYTIRQDGETWIEEGAVPGLNNLNSLLEQDDGTWWFGASFGGAVRVTFPDPSATSPGSPTMTTFAENAGLPTDFGWVQVSALGDHLLFQCELGVFRFDPKTQRVAPTAELGARFTDGTWTPRSLAPDPDGGVWIAAKRVGAAEISSTNEIGLADATGWHPLLLPEVHALDDISGLRVEPGDGADRGPTLWISGHSGLIRVDLDAWRRARSPVPPPVIVRAITQSDGTRLALSGDWELPFVNRSFTLTFAAPTGTTVTFESTLTGAGSPLVQTDASPQRTFTGLSTGTYQLKLRARNEGGAWSAPTALEFSVQSPWWATPWAWAAYLIIATFLVTLIVGLRTRTLRRRNDQLEAIVTERTREIDQLRLLEIDEKIAAKLGEEKARLEVLRYQLNPHFLFNALTSVCAHLPPSLPQARAIIEQLVDFCQLTLFRPTGDDLPTLEQEVKMLRAYLDIEQSRWEDLLKIELDVDPATTSEKIPPLLLLPLVENALKYGRATAHGAVTIRVRAFREPTGALVLEIANTGEWVDAADRGNVPSLGIGLENLRQRLHRYYPDAHEFTSHAGDGWVRVTLRLTSPARQL